MKNIKQQIALATLIVFTAISFTFANEAEYKLTIKNINKISSNQLEFDIYLQHTNPGESKFYYIAGQYLFDFNSNIANGGTLKYTLISSELPSYLQPANPTIAGNVLRLATNKVPSADNEHFTISPKEPGTLIARMRIETSEKEFSDAELKLECRVGPENPFTKICSFDGNKVASILNNTNEVATDNNAINKNEPENTLPKEYSLSQNYPNPFNPTTNIKFALPKESSVRLAIYDITGREIQVLTNGKLNAGEYEFQWNASQFASGIYFYKISADNFSLVKKMALVK